MEGRNVYSCRNYNGLFRFEFGERTTIASWAQQAAMKKQAQGASNQQLMAAIQTLQSVKLTLEKADHDYGGHRAAAVKDIAKAEQQLLRALHAHQKLGNAGKVPAMGEPQALSNAQLAQTIPVLSNTITLLGSANHDYGGHRQKAIQDLQAAINQLQVALKSAKQPKQNKNLAR